MGYGVAWRSLFKMNKAKPLLFYKKVSGYEWVRQAEEKRNGKP